MLRMRGVRSIMRASGIVGRGQACVAVEVEVQVQSRGSHMRKGNSTRCERASEMIRPAPVPAKIKEARELECNDFVVCMKKSKMVSCPNRHLLKHEDQATFRLVSIVGRGCAYVCLPCWRRNTASSSAAEGGQGVLHFRVHSMLPLSTIVHSMFLLWHSLTGRTNQPGSGIWEFTLALATNEQAFMSARIHLTRKNPLASKTAGTIKEAVKYQK